MTSKKCTQCGALKPLAEFYKQKAKKDGYFSACKTCTNSNKLQRDRTKSGLLCRIYMTQKASSIKRGHNPPEYTLEEFKRWALVQPKFHELYETWVNSGYQEMLSPSTDRTDDYQGYALHLLNWMTWAENKGKGYTDKKNGINNKNSKSVVQMTMIGLFVAKFHSGAQAGRDTGIANSDISSCCTGKLNSAGGFISCGRETPAFRRWR